MEKVFRMELRKVYPLVVAKAERKGRSRAELSTLVESDISSGDFFRGAPAPNPNRDKVTGSICGVKVEAVQDPLLRDIRILDKLVDELAKGKPLEKVLRK